MAPYDHDHSNGGGTPGPLCPVCRKPVIPGHKPFCSKRCADIDLHRWIEGVYRVPTKEPPESENGEEEK